EASGFPERMERRVRATFETLAEVEGRLHGVPPAEVHFHEVGAIDSIIDVVGTCAALEVLDIDEVWSSAVALGGGTIDSAHGTLPIPAPATIGLLGGAP
ncbi:MAG TPA: TIGR00299 family protein, partial [Acidimicrobiaceae bacterium]|nr:TIGR00299 family protein [Acidimicrobiaceae bacterium]